MTDPLVASVARRAAQTPRWLTDAVDSGQLDPSSVAVWLGVTMRLKVHFSMSAALAYWRNEAKKQDLTIPEEILDAPELGNWKVGDDLVADWERQSEKTEKVLHETLKLLRSWEVGLRYLRGLVRKVQQASPSWGQKPWDAVPVRVAGLFDELERAVDAYTTHTTPVVEFEQEIQFVVLLVKKRLANTSPFDDASKYAEALLKNLEKGEEVDLGTLDSALEDLTEWGLEFGKLVERCRALLAKG